MSVVNGTGNGEKGAQQKIHRGQQRCEVTDEDFRDDGRRRLLGMCDAFAGDYTTSRINEYKVTLRATRPPGI